MHDVPSIATLARRMRAGSTSSVEETEAALACIAADNERTNAFLEVFADAAHRCAREADHALKAGYDRGPLHGVPIAVKDIIDVRGTVTTAASRVRARCVAAFDAAVVAQLRHAGAVIVGKTNLHEFALGTTSEESAFGPVRNPIDPSRSPGGSSGGSAVAVATGMAVAALGTDTGGSIRIPAAACGVVGLKPSAGEIPTTGVVPLSPSLDHVGPLARTVHDAAVLFHVLTGREPQLSFRASRPSRLRLGVPRAYFCDMLDDGVRARFDAALCRLRRAGTIVEDVTIAHAGLTGAAYVNLTLPEAAAYHAATLERCPELYTPNVRLRLEAGRELRAEDYVRAQLARTVLTREVDEALAPYDALLLPTLPIPAPLIGATTVQVGSATDSVRAVMMRMTQLFNLTGHPAISLPNGATADGLPCGLQLVGHSHKTERLLRDALACERVLATSGRGIE